MAPSTCGGTSSGRDAPPRAQTRLTNGRSNRWGCSVGKATGIWISFADMVKPKGQMFVGVIIVKATEPNAAVARVVELGLWPKIPGSYIDIAMWSVDIEEYSPNDIDRMLTEHEAAGLGARTTVSCHVPSRGSA